LSNNLFLTSNTFFAQYPYFLLIFRIFCSSSVFVYGVKVGPTGSLRPWDNRDPYGTIGNHMGQYVSIWDTGDP